MSNAPTNRININRRIEHALYRTRPELINAPAETTVDLLLAQILGEILPLVDLAERLTEANTIQRAINAVRDLPTVHVRPGPAPMEGDFTPRVTYSVGDIIEVQRPGGGSRKILVVSRFIDRGDPWWGGEDGNGQALAGPDSRIIGVWKKAN